MSAYDKERLENLISFFAREFYKKNKYFISQTSLYKSIALFEFEILEETGRPPLYLKYQAMENGPVPGELYNNKKTIKSLLFKFVEEQNNKYKIHSLKSPNLDYFSEYEIEKLQNLVYIYYTSCNGKSEIMSKASHEKIKAWRDAYKRGKNSPINFDDTFTFENKEDLTSQEDCYLVFKEIVAMSI